MRRVKNKQMNHIANQKDIRNRNKLGSKTLRHNPVHQDRKSTISELTRDQNGDLSLASAPLSLNKNKRWEQVDQNEKVFVHQECRNNQTTNVINNIGIDREEEPKLEDMTIEYKYVQTRHGRKAVPINMPKTNKKKQEGAEKAQNHTEKMQQYQDMDSVYIVNKPFKREYKRDSSLTNKDHYTSHWESGNPNITNEQRAMRYRIMESVY
eukprot:TRINITY_DN1825_c0_g1_i1.p1 TRINITY_DN1825_c0_g1~~TRINITY_DN1825_c0_g1_i1.p1  ORF type:complete len:209 (+),score=41.61 TRINITY_DN1825_c0_g1_i1:235-861(+)